MHKDEIQKQYNKKINKIKECDKAYFEDDNPIISDADYDDLKKIILNFEKKYKFIKKVYQIGNKVGYKPSNKFQKINA